MDRTCSNKYFDYKHQMILTVFDERLARYGMYRRRLSFHVWSTENYWRFLEPFEWPLWYAVCASFFLCALVKSLCSFLSPFGFRGRYIQRRHKDDHRHKEAANNLNLNDSLWYSFGAWMAEVSIERHLTWTLWCYYQCIPMNQCPMVLLCFLMFKVLWVLCPLENRCHEYGYWINTCVVFIFDVIKSNHQLSYKFNAQKGMTKMESYHLTDIAAISIDVFWSYHQQMLRKPRFLM